MAISTREELIDALSVAAELEHGFMAQYLFAAFSMKKSTNEGIAPHQEALVKSWEGKILEVARAEMAHLGTVCNLLSAIGAAPHFGRPNFPQPGKAYYPFEVKLTRCSDETIYRFIRYELPKGVDPPSPPGSLTSNAEGAEAVRAPVEYEFVGELYEKIRDAFQQLPRLFIGPVFAQDADTWSGRLHLKPVKDTKSAVDAIKWIIEEGEGSSVHRESSHYQAFSDIRKEFNDELIREPTFDPARKVISNPRTLAQHADAPALGTLITREQTRQVAGIFNDVHEIAIVMLMQFYSFGGETTRQRRELQNAARAIMSAAVRPLAEILTQMPAFEPDDGWMAGAPFEFYSIPRLPPQLKPRWLILLQRLENAGRDIRAHVQVQPDKKLAGRLGSIADKIDWLGGNIEKVLLEEMVLEPKDNARPEI
jgi:hypothetical protein